MAVFMIRRKNSQATLALLFALLAAGATARLAAQGDIEAGESSPEPTPEAGKASTEIDQPKEDPKPETPDSKDNSPYDYESSEEISEDRSVSFPVDI
jgi:hypothetical protein